MHIVLTGFPWRQILHPGNGAGGWKASPKGEIQLTAGLREELEFWRFLDEWDKHIPWKDEKHWVLSVSTDASLSCWAGVIHCQPNDVVLGDFWESDLAELNINVKEMWAIAKVLESLPSDIRDCRVDVQVDNQAAIHTWMGRGGRSRELTEVARHIFQLVTQRNILLELSYVPSKSNPADSFSRSLSKSDSMLSKHCWEMVEAEFGGLSGHNLDLMALDSNAQCDRQGSSLPHFTPYPTPRSARVNVFNQDLTNCDGVTVNPYVFPPFSMIPSLISLLSSQKAVATMVVPCLSPLPSWWPMVRAMSSKEVLLVRQSSSKSVKARQSEVSCLVYYPGICGLFVWTGFNYVLALILFSLDSLCYSLCLKSRSCSCPR